MQAAPEFLLVSIPLSLVDWGGAHMVGALGLFVAFQNLLIHAPLRVHAGPLRFFYVDNRFHRIHHSAEERHWHRNFGLMFSIWDRVFGTAVEPLECEWPGTGVPGLAPTLNPIKFMLRPLTAGARPAENSLENQVRESREDAAHAAAPIAMLPTHQPEGAG